MSKVVNLKFKEGKFGKPVSSHGGKLVLLDKKSPISPKVEIGDEWQCKFLFDTGKFKVFEPISRTHQENPSVEDDDFYKEEFEPSKYQKGVYDFVQFGSGNAVVNAVAGSGKTTTLIGALRRIPKDKTVLFLAFNKSIVKELQKKVPKSMYNVVISTVHSYGAKAVMKAYKSEIYARKYDDIIKDMSKGWTDVEGNILEYRAKVKQLCDLGRLNIVRNAAELESLAEKYSITLTNGECKRAVRVIRQGIKNTSKIDFTDMIYLPIVYDLEVPQFDMVFIDECQDLNACQRRMMLKAMKKGTGRFIGVGDNRQAIYGFAGADSESFDKLVNLPNTKKLPLSICYRCPTSIVNLAKQIVPQIEPREGADKGVVDNNAKLADVNDGDMVICRTTFPLIRLCIKYLSSGRKASIMGRDIGENLCNMVKNTKESTMKLALKKLYAEQKIVLENIMNKKGIEKQEAEQTSTYQLFKEKVYAIEVLAEGKEMASDVIDFIRSIFSDEESEGITLSTIHKTKGLENDRIFIIHEDQLPAKWAADQPWMLEQEYNLMYVAYTRAKKYLGFIQDFDAYKD